MSDRDSLDLADAASHAYERFRDEVLESIPSGVSITATPGLLNAYQHAVLVDLVAAEDALTRHREREYHLSHRP